MSLTKEKIDSLLYGLDNDELKELKSEIENRLSNIVTFIDLYNTTYRKINEIIKNENNNNIDIWSLIWHKLFGPEKLIEYANSIYQFDTDIIDSSYENEVRYIMDNWKEKVDSLTNKEVIDNYWDSL